MSILVIPVTATVMRGILCFVAPFANIMVTLIVKTVTLWMFKENNMKADEMALECARQLKAYCDAQANCDNCVFNKLGIEVCVPEYGISDWDIPDTIGSPTDDDGK